MRDITVLICATKWAVAIWKTQEDKSIFLDATPDITKKLCNIIIRNVLYDIECNSGPMQPIYRFGDALIDEQGITFTDGRLHIPGFAQDILLNSPNPYPDMVE